MSILLIDIGNTSIHWRVITTDKVLTPTVSLRHKHKWDKTLKTLDTTVNDSEIKEVWVSSVAGDEVKSELTTWSERQFKQTPNFVHSEKEFLSVANAYTQAKQLGVDRWLALIGGHELIVENSAIAAVIVDAGTAMTIDVILENGEHLGGNITAGLRLQQETLLKNTKEIKASEGDHRDWGEDTASAVAAGARFALVGAVLYAVELLRSQLAEQSVQAGRDGVTNDSEPKLEEIKQPAIQVMLTGGDAEVLEGELLPLQGLSILENVNVSIHSNLVLDGLARYAFS